MTPAPKVWSCPTCGARYSYSKPQTTGTPPSCKRGHPAKEMEPA